MFFCLLSLSHFDVIRALRYLIVSVLDDNQEENLFKTSCRVAMLLHTSTDATIKAESRLQSTISQAATTKKVHR